MSKQVWKPDEQWRELKKGQVESWQALRLIIEGTPLWEGARTRHRRACQALRVYTNTSRSKWLSKRLHKVSLFGDSHSAKHTWETLKRSLGSEIMSGLPTKIRTSTGDLLSGKEADKQWHEVRASISKFDSTAPFYPKAQKKRKLQMSTILRQEQDSAAAATHPKQSEGIMNAKIEQMEVQSSLQRASKNTAPGTDEVYNELLTQGGEYMQQVLHLLLNVVWAQEQGPEEWDCALVRPLYKPKAKDPLLIENYRAVTLINTVCKLYEDTLCARVVHHLEDNR